MLCSKPLAGKYNPREREVGSIFLDETKLIIPKEAVIYKCTNNKYR